MTNYKEERPWGNFEVLYDGEDCKVKRITVYPGKRLSLQSHKHREENWTCVSGELTVYIETEDGFPQPGEKRYVATMTKNQFQLRSGMSTWIKQGLKHRALNLSDEDAVFIEVQTGTYFGEDDIIRYEDDYGRT